MKVEAVLILAAGQGTRMKKIGKILPKVTWPIFERSILELQVEYARELIPEAKIFINTYFQKEKIKSFFDSQSSFRGTELLEEEEVLDIGGGVHHLARRLDYKGKLLIINGDQFLCFSKSSFLESLNRSLEFDHLIFSKSVNSNEGYNALDVREGRLVDIIKNDQVEEDKEMRTYTGMSLINLENLVPSTGESKFFETVANFKKQRIGTLQLDTYEYWDFGTVNRYYESMFRVLERNSEFYDFLVRNRSIFPERIREDSYNSNSGINLSTKELANCGRAILIKDGGVSYDHTHAQLIYEDLVELIHLS